jgi:ketosteroid isomerase-like protein
MRSIRGVQLDEARLRLQNAKFNRAFSHGEIDAWLDELTPDAEIGTVTAIAEGRVLRGHDDARRYMERLHEAFEEMAVQADSFEALADGLVLTLGRWRAVGRGSGVPVDSQWAVATQLASDYRMVWARAFTDEGEARAAASERAAALGLRLISERQPSA